MKLLTLALRKLLPPLYSQEHVEDPLVVCKFFCPWNRWTWYAIEFDLVDGDAQEMGYFLLSDLAKTVGRFGLKIERDLHFKPALLSTVQSKS